jgi:hypothetical protein
VHQTQPDLHLDPLMGQLTQWFPLVPRPRPIARPLPRRINEVEQLANNATGLKADAGISTAAEALNKAALILSDCGHPDVAIDLCWTQFDTFAAAAPLTTKTAKLALQPIVNLGRALTRTGKGARAYEVVQNTYTAVTHGSQTLIDTRTVNFGGFTDTPEAHQELRRFLWTVLLADGTRALTTTGQWPAALQHLEQHRGIGQRLLDGRQVAVIAACIAGDHEHAQHIIDSSTIEETWENAIAAYLRALNLHLAGRLTGASINEATNAADQVRYVTHPLLHTRLALAIYAMAKTSRTNDAGWISHTTRSVLETRDAYACRELLTHHATDLNDQDADRLAEIVDLAGLSGALTDETHLAGLYAAADIAARSLADLLV